MLKIGEFSQLGQVSVRMLRHYDATGLLEPAAVDHLSGYRFYAVEQLPRLNRILALKDLGLSLEQIRLLLDEGDDDPLPSATELRGMLTMRQADLEQELREGRERLARVEARLKQIEREDKPSPYEVVLEEVAPLTVAAARVTVPSIEDMPLYRCTLYEGLHGWLKSPGSRESGPEMAIYHLTEFAENDIDMEVAVVVNSGAVNGGGPELLGAKAVVRGLPAAPEVASVVHRGPLREVTEAVKALFVWVGEYGYSAAGPVREIHLFWNENGEAEKPHGLEAVTVEMQLPVIKSASTGT